MAPQASIEQSILLFLEFMMVSKRHMSDVGAGCDLTSMQTITVLLLNQPKSMHNFRQLYNCDASNITGIVDGLEQKKLVQRCEHPTDRRVKMIELTKDGDRVRAVLVKKLSNHSHPLSANLNEDEFQQLMHLLQKMNASSEFSSKDAYTTFERSPRNVKT